MRLFTAITLPKEVKMSLNNISQQMQKQSLKGTFSDYINYHITLVFLGEVPESSIGDVKKIIDKASKLFSPMFLNSFGLGYFKKGNKKILYYNVGGNIKILSDVQSFLYDEFYVKGLCKKQSGYTPHITFARQVLVESLPEIKAKNEFASGEITLMHSTRIAGKLTYLPIYRSPFIGAFTVDRVEEGIAVCENQSGRIFNINKNFLPKGISSGTKISYNGLKFKLNKNEQKNKLDEMRAKFNKEIRKL